MTAAAFILLGMFGYLCWFFGQLHQARADYRQEKLDYQAYEWASRHGRLPTVVRYVDLETGLVLEESHDEA